jgi:hypothetical protein
MDDALVHIIGRLVVTKRVFLVGCLAGHTGGGRVVVDGNENTIRSLKKGPAPLVEQDGMERYLSPLGVAVAQMLADRGVRSIPTTQPDPR